MKQLALLLMYVFICLAHNCLAQANKLNDGNWTDRYVIMNNTPEAEVMIRAGDIDNLNFGFEEGFNPFCGTTTTVHAYPWEPVADDPAGTDRIMVPSSFHDNSPCGGDGYSGFDRSKTMPQAIKLNTKPLAGVTIKSALLLLFVDDFQAPGLCSKFQVTLNGKRFYDAEKIINALDQTGPVGKLLTIPVSEDLFATLKENELNLKIDDPATGAADGYAIDFVKLLINYKPEFACVGTLKGVVLEDGSNTPIAEALVEVRGFGETHTDAEGRFSISGLPAGMQVANAGKEGYNSAYKAGDVSTQESEELTIYLKPARKTATYAGRQVKQGESLVINNILFEQGSADLRKESMAELDKIVAFLKSNAEAQIELSGHTSSEGSRELNRSLSFRRVNSCRAYITGKGLGGDRISIVGYGPDRPIANNDTEEGRNKNRRVEMKVLKL